jgi:hypothetical protein
VIAGRHASGLALLAALIVGCAGTTAAPAPAELAALPDRASCEVEASLLAEAADVHAAPGAESALVARLAAGRFVYRCERRGEWLGVMFPQQGERIDCSRRPAGKACSLGWVRKQVRMEILG